jgi:hypothetical protein
LASVAAYRTGSNARCGGIERVTVVKVPATASMMVPRFALVTENVPLKVASSIGMAHHAPRKPAGAGYVST